VKSLIYKNFSTPIKFYQVLLVSGIVIFLSVIYATITNEPIADEILEQIRKNRATEVHQLEKNRMQIHFMKERGWNFIVLASLLLSIVVWMVLSNHRKKRTNFLGYTYRIKDRLAQSETKTLTFQERLREKFEMLTSNDLLIAEMLVDGLSTKQISTELNISPASANTARYRLRKKMNLSLETDLVTSLQEI
jgi:DNA-binding CsgD family transcriptional regulator